MTLQDFVLNKMAIHLKMLNALMICVIVDDKMNNRLSQCFYVRVSTKNQAF